MPQSHDVMLNGAGYMLVPGSYRYENTGAAVEAVRVGVSQFSAGVGVGDVGPVVVDRDSLRWSAVGMMPLPIGLGDGAGRIVLAPAEGQIATGTGVNFDQTSAAIIYGGSIYFSEGANLYRINTVGGAYSSITFIGAAAGVITSMMVQAGILYMGIATGANMANYTTGGAIAATPAGAVAALVFPYAQGIWRSKRNDTTAISGSIDGGATWTEWKLDSPVKAVIPWRGRSTGGGVMLVATQYMLWELAGQWVGSPAAFSGTVSILHDTHGGGGLDDFQYLVEYQGKVYTWFAGACHRFDGHNLEPLPGGPRGQVWGMCVAGGLLCVSVKDTTLATWSIYLYDGARWIAMVQSSGIAYNQLFGAGGLMAGAHLLSLDWATATISYWDLPMAGLTGSARTSGSVTAGPLDAGAGDAVKVFTSLVCAWSTALYPAGTSAPANPGGSLALAYSVDDGSNWVTVGTLAVAAGARAGLYQPAIAGAGVEATSFLVRATWTPTSAYAAFQVDGLWAAGWKIDDKPKRETWTLGLRCTDKLLKRDGTVDARTGQTMLQALRALAQSGGTFTFQDNDFDLNARSITARILDLKEGEKKGDGVHFTETVCTMTLMAVG